MGKKVDLSFEERTVLDLLVKYKALSYDCVAEMGFGGDAKLSYRALYDLKRKRLILTRRDPRDNRQRYVLLSKAGIRYVPEKLQAAHLSVYAHRNRAERDVEANKLYVLAIKSGIPPEVLLHRDGALSALEVNPAKTPLDWLAHAGENRFAMYLRRPDKRSSFLQSFDEIGVKVRGHVLFYPSNVDLGRDRRWFVQHVLPGNVYLLRLTDMPVFASLLRDPSGWLDRIKDALDVLSPGGCIYRAPSGCPLSWMWDKRGNPLLLGDLSVGNVGLVSCIKDLRLDYMKDKRWGNGILFLVRDERDASVWANLLEHRPWIWFLTEKSPALYRCRGGELVLFRSVQDQRGDDLVAEAR